jgi:hypothetical protein
VPGKPVTDQQVRLYMQDRPRHSRRVAAARAGFSERTAGRIEADPRLPSQRRVQRGRTVPDPLAEVWEATLLPILERDPSVQAVTLLRQLQMTDPDTFPDDRVRRTLVHQRDRHQARRLKVGTTGAAGHSDAEPIARFRTAATGRDGVSALQ